MPKYAEEVMFCVSRWYRLLVFNFLTIMCNVAVRRETESCQAASKMEESEISEIFRFVMYAIWRIRPHSPFSHSVIATKSAIAPFITRLPWPAMPLPVLPAELYLRDPINFDSRLSIFESTSHQSFYCLDTAENTPIWLESRRSGSRRCSPVVTEELHRDSFWGVVGRCTTLYYDIGGRLTTGELSCCRGAV